MQALKGFSREQSDDYALAYNTVRTSPQAEGLNGSKLMLFAGIVAFGYVSLKYDLDPETLLRPAKRQDRFQ